MKKSILNNVKGHLFLQHYHTSMHFCHMEIFLKLHGLTEHILHSMMRRFYVQLGLQLSCFAAFLKVTFYYQKGINSLEKNQYEIPKLQGHSVLQKLLRQRPIMF
uniref:Uncharacterized protein n=2 Tax=Micrurus TaxID=8634 RepID=A0A2D4F9S1_MICCO